MTLYNQFFGEFTKSCAKLYLMAMPWALVIYVLAIAIEFSRGTDVRRLLTFFARVFVLILLTSNARHLMNSGGVVIENTINNSGLVRPEKTAEAYKTRLSAALGDDAIKDRGFLSLLFSTHFFDGLIYGAFLLVNFLVLLVVTFITLVQKVSLLVCWSVSPVLFACLAMAPAAHLGSAHIWRCIAVLCWPLGFALAATFSDALLNIAIHVRVLPDTSIVNSLGSAIETLLIVAVIGVWNVYSTIYAPAFIHKFLVGQAGPAQFVPDAVSKATSAALSIGTVIVGGTTAAFSAVIAWWQGRSNRNPSESPGSSTPPAPPPPAPSAPPSAPSNPPTPSDPTGADALKRLINDR